MSWDDLPATGSYAKAAPAVEFAIGKMPRGHSKVATVVLRQRCLTVVPAFLAPGLGVQVLRGRGNDSGKLRILPGGCVAISKSGHGTNMAMMIRTPLWVGLTDVLQRAAVTYRISQEALEIDLPEWACVDHLAIGRAA